MKKNIIFCSGGTGGHVFPAIRLVNYFKVENNVTLVTDIRTVKYIKDPKYNIKILNISSISKKNLILNLFSLIKIFIAFLGATYYILKKKIDIIFGFGGYVSFPFLLAAKLLNKKIYLYEPNLVLGKTNKFFLKSCEKIFTYSNEIINKPKKYSSKFIEVGPINREEISKFKNYSKKLNKDTKTVIILGGSQGAKIFGEIIPNVILNIYHKGIKIDIIQQTTTDQIKKVKNFYDENNIKNNVFDFHLDIFEFISKCDLAISRSGASTISELEFFKVPFIAIPYPYATDNHQYENALYYEKNHKCSILEQKDLTEKNLEQKILNFFNNNGNFEIKEKNIFFNQINNTLEIIKDEITN